MIYGNAAWGFRETPLEEQFKITADMGLDVIEIGIANAPADIALDATDAELDKVKVLSEKYGVKMLCAATGDDFTAGADDVEKVKKVIDICDKLGIKYLRIFAGFMPLADVTESVFEMMMDSLTKVCNYAKDKDIIPVIETHGGVDVYDDGVVQDIRLIKIMDQYGLRGTFNINSGAYLAEEAVRERYYGRIKKRNAGA